MRFQVGDVVRGTQKGDEVYSITNSNMIKGAVIGVRVRDGIEYFDIKVKAHAIQSFVGRCYYHLCSDCFELAQILMQVSSMRNWKSFCLHSHDQPCRRIFFWRLSITKPISSRRNAQVVFSPLQFILCNPSARKALCRRRFQKASTYPRY